MPHQLYEPGERKGNKWVVARFFIAGHPINEHPEKVLKGFTTKASARTRAMELELELLAEVKALTSPDTKSDITFKQAAYIYAKWRKLDLDHMEDAHGHQREEIRRMNRLIGSALGPMNVRDIKLTDLQNAADVLQPAAKSHPDKHAVTQNRQVMRPAAAILHHVSDMGYCPWLKVKLFKELPPETRTVSGVDERKLLDAEFDLDTPLDFYRRLMIMWLFFQFTRITQTLTVTWDHIDLNGRPHPTYKFLNKKTNKWEYKPIDPEVFEMLASIPEGERHGKLWPWTHRNSVYGWTRPLIKKLGVIKFTPHMARHTAGASLNAAGQSLRTIMDTLGHMDPKSSIRYQSTDINGVSDAMAAAKLRKAS